MVNIKKEIERYLTELQGKLREIGYTGISEEIKSHVMLNVETLAKDGLPVKGRVKLTDAIQGLMDSIDKAKKILPGLVEKAKSNREALDSFVGILEIITKSVIAITDAYKVAKRANILLSNIDAKKQDLETLGANYRDTDKMLALRNRLLNMLEEDIPIEQKLLRLEEIEKTLRELEMSIREKIMESAEGELKEIYRAIKEALSQGKKEIPATDYSDEEIAKILEKIPKLRFNPLRRVFMIYGEENE